MRKFISTVLAALCAFSSYGQTIAEKKESFHRTDSEMDPETLEQLRYVNQELDEKRFALKELYDEAFRLYCAHASKKNYDPILCEIRALKAEIAEIQRMWRGEMASFIQNDEYALWHQPETSLQQLVMDYGSPDFIYIVPPEVGGIRMSLNSSLPIPRESWGECLELILSQYGIGVREINPYLRELYVMRNDPSGIKGIVDQVEELNFYPPLSRVCFLLTPSATDPRGDLHFLQQFSNRATTKVEILGGNIFITATVESIQELLKLYTFSKSGNRGQDFQLVSLSKIDAKEMEWILNSAFHDGGITVESSSLRVMPLNNLSQSLFLSGTKSDVKRAIELIRDVESQIEDPQEKTVFWYTTKHSDAEELATVLAQVYDLLVGQEHSGGRKGGIDGRSDKRKEDKLVVPAISVGPTGEKRTSHRTADGQNNFIVDPKTGAIIMVVEQEALPKIKELLKKLDVPKKMVQIEVLLFEKKVSNSNKSGLNLLRLGSEATAAASTGLGWSAGPGGGILEFLISRQKGSGIPAYDLAYQFMLGQDDVQINASPSVTTINQTPATIAIVEEISIDAGADDKKNKIYNRAQYGITMQITPTINMDETTDGEAFITLDTDITFDTTKNNPNDRPDVTRRHIKNHVRIADGQTVILGGLRRKSTQDTKDSIPFLGEIPGIGKLFSHTDMQDSSTEMFVFITPKIISDPIEDAERLRREELTKRPGDIPEFLHELVEAQKREKKRLFQGSLTALFGRETSATANISNRKRAGEYNGR
ncbi:MAG: type II secretion system protein GspD [Chlamydiales bacterium]|nr:type II secretion system protein GspD [Chlamydiales bacterium]